MSLYFTSSRPRFGQATITVRNPFSPLANNFVRTSYEYMPTPASCFRLSWPSHTSSTDPFDRPVPPSTAADTWLGFR